MSNYTYDTGTSKPVDNNSIKRVKSVLIGAVSFFVPLALGVSSNSSETLNESADAYEHRSLSASADIGTNPYAFQSEDSQLYFAAPTYTNTGAEVSLETINDYDEHVNSLVLQMKEDEENETFFASDFITNLFSQDSTMCVSVLNKAFALQSYKYATWVIDAIRLSDVDFLQQWFKNLLIKGMQQKEHSVYMKDIYELYEKELETL